MKETLSVRILGGEEGSYVDKKVDRAYAHDGTGVQALEAFRNFRMKSEGVKNPEKISIIYDHIAPANNSTTANLQRHLRSFAKEEHLSFYDVGSGICHQIMSEGICLPNEIVVGADSHSCTLGALGAFATGVGATDMAGIWATGQTWFRVPKSIGIHLDGKLCGHAEAKDVALTYVKNLGMDGGTYKALEFIGEGAKAMPMEGRLTLCNMAIETGAKTGLFYADQTTKKYLQNHGVEEKMISLQKPENCDYEKEIYLDLERVEPLLAVDNRVDTAVPVSRYAETPVDQILVGTCTNGRYEDLQRFANIVRGKQVAVRTLIVPASKDVYRKAASSGIITDLIDAGCVICPPGCGPCLGVHMGVLGEGELGLSTANRNFKNRMGVGAEYYLCSPSTAAASALTGEITSPDSLLGGD
ncbi:aconitase/3-isopropylmalate dehydratase large subunit family protein [Methanorbis rubei]|uniref:3-isopropylmalate dehydratase large subunit n=1 Tax=Methanorbis rubei TaxID=3028300 RepID=A0AAE4MF30_9EURY|nr:3-isopropylmalate dehydratase large subunit [Methanocorpusculaceae archaeon Cs1]